MIDLNFVYTDHKEPTSIIFENDVGRVWMNGGASNKMANIAMNSYSALSKKQNDSIFIAEPICVHPDNYNINFLKQFRFIFAWATKSLENTAVANKLVHVNFPSYRNNPQINKDGWLPWNERSNEIVFIANNKSSQHPSELYSLRIKLADWLHANSKLSVSWYGNMPVRKPYYKGNLSSKSDILRKVKFSVCMENSYDKIYSDSFLTEKLPDVWFSGAIPIYMGVPNLNELGISNECYINLLPFRNNFTELEHKLSEFSENDYNHMTDSYIKLNDNKKLFELTSYEHMFEIMLNAYNS